MAKPVEAVTDATIDKGGVLALLYFDVYGDDKEKIEGMLVDLSNRISGAQGVVYALGSIERAIEVGEEAGKKKFSAAAEIKVLTQSFTALAKLCGMYGPMGIEILKPTAIKLSMADAQTLLFETSQMSHEFVTTMLYRMLSPQERIDLKKKLERRAEMGKDILKKSKEEKK